MRTILANARLLPQPAGTPRTAAIALRDGRIEAFGAHASDLARAGDRVIDVGERRVAPGFCDCHMHVLPYGILLGQADLSPEAGVETVADLVRALRTWAAAHPGSPWALGNRYDHNRFPGARHPDRRDLDAAFPDTPALVTHTSGHAAAANSAALRIAGVHAGTPDPPGGRFERDEHGEPTGVLLEMAAALVARAAPAPDRSAMVNAVHAACGALVRKGVTAATDMGVAWYGYRAAMAAYPLAVEQGAPVRITLYPEMACVADGGPMPDRRDYEAAAGIARAGSEGVGGLRLGGAKLFEDGALTTRTAALREPFADGSGTGMLIHAPDDLRSMAVAAHLAGWQLAIHAIGDRAIDACLDAIEAARRASSVDRRHRIEHAMLLDRAQMRRFADLGVIAVMQPEFVARLGDAYVTGLGPERAARLNPAASLAAAGARVAFSSDCPVVPGAPLDGMRAAAERVTPRGRVLGIEQRVDPLTSLTRMTRDAAWSLWDETETGSLEPGMRADLVVLGGVDEDAANLVDATVDATLVGGIPVFGADSLA